MDFNNNPTRFHTNNNNHINNNRFLGAYPHTTTTTTTHQPSPLTLPNNDQELTEDDIPNSHFYHKTSAASSSSSTSSAARLIPSIPKPPSLMSRSLGPHYHHQSAPVNVPVFTHRARRRQEFDEIDLDDDDGDGDGEEMMPPHEIVARSHTQRTAAYSVLEGAGRTLKGRDLRQVRNAIWQQTVILQQLLSFRVGKNSDMYTIPFQLIIYKGFIEILEHAYPPPIPSKPSRGKFRSFSVFGKFLKFWNLDDTDIDEPQLVNYAVVISLESVNQTLMLNLNGKSACEISHADILGMHMRYGVFFFFFLTSSYGVLRLRISVNMKKFSSRGERLIRTLKSDRIVPSPTTIVRSGMTTEATKSMGNFKRESSDVAAILLD
ncbi:hypothetical protein ACFE04_018846 [Oxalis oulophora]